MVKRKINWIVWSGVLGILLFLVLLGILNAISGSVSNSVFQEIVSFLNRNILLIILISVVLLLGNVFEVIVFPFNLLYPLFNAIGGILWVELIFKIFGVISSSIGQDILTPLIPLYPLAVITVPIVVLVVGYVHVFSGLAPAKEKRREMNLEWEEVGEELKWAVYNFVGTLKRAFEPKKVERKVRKVVRDVKRDVKKDAKKRVKKK